MKKILLLCLVASCTVYRPVSPQSIQAKIISYKFIGRGQADLICLSKKGDSMFVRYGWGMGTKNQLIKPGAWITVSYDANDCEPGKYVKVSIKVNR